MKRSGTRIAVLNDVSLVVFVSSEMGAKNEGIKPDGRRFL
jgi:hypothetical protein